MKRSNRLVLLVGVFLAIVAFVGILVLSSGTPKVDPNAPPTEALTVIATQDIPLGTRILANQVKEQMLPVGGRDADAFGSVTQVIGQVARQQVIAGAAITQRTLSGGTQGAILNIDCPTLLRCMSVQVDQVTGVGTVIKPGDYVDAVVGFTGEKFPVITTNPTDDSFTVVSGINSTSVKLLVQGVQVMGTLLPPPPAQEGEAPPADPTTVLSGQQQIVIIAVTPQQAEIIKFAQLDGSVSLILRATDDFIDPTTNEPVKPIDDQTSGVVLKALVDTYGVLPPELVETVLPAQAGN